ncbi:MAG: FtsX-like permease family protein [Planctomycetota bacterium]
MSVLDIIKMAWLNLWQRKLKSSLNLIGIVLGSTIVLLTAAGVNGVDDALRMLFDSSEFAREVEVSPSYRSSEEPPEAFVNIVASMPEDRRERIRESLVQWWQQQNRDFSSYQITKEHLQQISRLEGALRVVPESGGACQMEAETWMTPPDHLDWIPDSNYFVGLDVEQNATRSRLVAGTLPDESNRDRMVVVSEVQAYRMGFASSNDYQSLIGKQVTVTYKPSVSQPDRFQRILDQTLGIDDSLKQKLSSSIQKVVAAKDELALDPVELMIIKRFRDALKPMEAVDQVSFLKRRKFEICGVMKTDDKEWSISSMFQRFSSVADSDLMLHYKTSMEMSQDEPRPETIRGATLVVTSTKYLQSSEDKLLELGLRGHSALWAWERIESQVDAAGMVVYAIGLTILLTSAIGITNTLIISVMQRTREFGILKSIGMRDRDLMAMMIFEGTLLGILGSILATLLAFVLAQLGHRFISAYVDYRAGEPIQGDLLQFDWPPILLTFVIATSICAAASIIPAWRASRLDPVDAMRRD